MSEISDADREKARRAISHYFSTTGGAAATIDTLIAAGWRPLVSATLDPKPWHEYESGLRFSEKELQAEVARDRQWRGLRFDPRPEYVQDRAAYEPAPATPEREALREQIARQVYRILYPGPINRHDSQRTPESDAAEKDRAFDRWDTGKEGYAPGRICRSVADAVLAVLPSRETVAPMFSNDTFIDLYWRTTGDDWAIPEEVMVKYGRAVLALLPGESREAVEAKARAEVIDWIEAYPLADYIEEAREQFGIEADRG